MAFIRTQRGQRATTYEVRYRDPAGRERQQTFRRKSDAQRFAREVEVAKDRGQYHDPRKGRQTLMVFYEAWLERQTLAPGTVTSMNLALRSCPFADWQLRAIDRAAVERWVVAMSRAGLAPLTVRARLSSVRRVLRAAVADGILMRDPTAGVKAPRTPTTEETNIPTTAEVAALLAHLREPFRAMATVCALAGLRLGEVGGLQAGDLDAAAAVLRVRRQSQPVRGAGMGAVPPKSASSVRDVPVPAELVRILDDAQRGLPAGAWLWSSPATGHPWRPSTLHKHMAEAAEAAGVPGIGWHSLRHYYASGLIRDGLDAVTVAGALGHSSPSVTLSVYAHVWPDASGRVRASSQSLATALLGDECED